MQFWGLDGLIGDLNKSPSSGSKMITKIVGSQHSSFLQRNGFIQKESALLSQFEPQQFKGVQFCPKFWVKVSQSYSELPKYLWKKMHPTLLWAFLNPKKYIFFVLDTKFQELIWLKDNLKALSFEIVILQNSNSLQRLYQEARLALIHNKRVRSQLYLNKSSVSLMIKQECFQFSGFIKRFKKPL